MHCYLDLASARVDHIFFFWAVLLLAGLKLISFTVASMGLHLLKKTWKSMQSLSTGDSILRKQNPCECRMSHVQAGLPHLLSCTANTRTILDDHNDYENARVQKWSALLLITVADCYCKVTLSVYVKCQKLIIILVLLSTPTWQYKTLILTMNIFCPII